MRAEELQSDPREELRGRSKETTERVPIADEEGAKGNGFIAWDVAGMTDVGLRRSSNQDHILMDAKNGIFLIADGMGGHRAGERASRMACIHVYRFIRNELHSSMPAELQPVEPRKRWTRAMRLAAYSANRYIYDYACAQPRFKGMGTTFVALLVHDDHAYVAHAGDSRLYRVQAGAITRVTRDHSRLQDLIDQYNLTEEAARNHPFRNVITRSLGNHPDVEIDIMDFDVEQAEMLLLCTDGLCGVLTDGQILHIVESAKGDMSRGCRLLLQAVNRAGAPDNVSILIARPKDKREPAAL
ncbi:MAG: Stp1/IreP family PP2C-type Ser/Thr phosphatase [Candidatus Schekmanbacteria bacterium]|nr:Stp1/IreP family PP2C-type Ser/Thr phosphatase [Candidatus Schekmanbacteria bacterium]